MSDLATTTLLAAIAGAPDGFYITADTWRDEADAAQLTSAEKSGALRAACRGGYLRPVTVLVPGFINPVQVSMPTKHEAGKGRSVLLWRRTDLPVPDHLCGVA